MIVYATATTVDAAFSGAGVYRLQLSAGAVQSAPPGWSNVSGGLTSVPAADGTLPQYDVIATPASAADTVYVGMPTGLGFGPPSWTIWKGQWDVVAGQMAWRGAFDGFTNQADHNVEPGWIDEAEINPADPKPQPALGFGFGGPPHGIACAPGIGDVTLQTSEAFTDLTTTGAPNVQGGWQQVYSRGIQTFAGPRWRTTGLDVTNVWYYRVHPDPSKASIHFLANTDISLSRSDDAGDTWQLIYPHRGVTFWGNVYELEFNVASGEMWAAVSTEHDLPYSNQLDWEAQPGHSPGPGAVLRSTDDGLNWSELGTGLPNHPVLSVAYGGSPAALYTGVWRQGVYQLQPGNAWQRVGDVGGGRRVRRVGFDKASNLLAFVSGIDDVAGLYRWNGTNWVALTASLATAYYPAGKFYPFDFAVDPAINNSLWLCTSGVAGGPGGAVYRTDDGGTSWTVVFNFGSMGSAGPQYQTFLHCTAIAFDPNDVTGQMVYVTTETHGTWYSTNRGITWQEFTAVPFTAMQRLTFDPHDIGTLYLATKGAGAWRTMSAAKASSIHQTIRREAYWRSLARGDVGAQAFDDWVAAFHHVMDQSIQVRAYELAQMRNFVAGRALDDWLQAEVEARRTLGV